MTETALTIKFTAPADQDGDFILLEQFKSDMEATALTKAGVYHFLNAKLFDRYSGPVTRPADPRKYVFAYPSPPELPYRFGMSWGTFGPLTVRDKIMVEAIRCNLELVITPKYPVVTIHEWQWVGGVYDQKGTRIIRPVINRSDDGRSLILEDRVYGLLSIVYHVIQHEYLVNVPVRDEPAENKYPSYAYAVWDGGNTYLGLDPLPPVEGGGGGGGTIIEDDDDKDDDDYIKGEDEIHEFDYCTGEELT